MSNSRSILPFVNLWSSSLLMLVQSLDHWKSFFANHAKYRLIGKVLHAPIEPSSPIPPPCQQEGEESSDTGPHGPKAADAPDPSGSGSGGARATGEL